MTTRADAEALLREAAHEDWLTVKEFARLMRVTDETVRRWLRAGHLHATRTIEPHGHYRIKRTARPSAA